MTPRIKKKILITDAKVPLLWLRNNVRKNKDGKWIGTRMTVDRSVNDIIPADAALNESMLNCSKQIESTDTGGDEDDADGNEIDDEDDADRNEIDDEEIKDDGEEINGKEEANVENKNCNTEGIVQLRRSERVRKQRYELNPDDIGDDDSKSDADYIQVEGKQQENIQQTMNEKR